jgi:hypothetical protein
MKNLILKIIKFLTLFFFFTFIYITFPNIAWLLFKIIEIVIVIVCFLIAIIYLNI